MSFPRYAEYKDSGVEWLGEVPGHWDICAMKRIVSLKSGETINSEHIEETGEYPVYGGNGLRGYTYGFTHEGFYPLIGRQGALCGNVNYANGKFWASEHAVVVSSIKKVVPLWLGELLRAMDLNQYSVSAAQPGLSVEIISNLPIPIPPLPEQSAIATFLDRQTAKIDALVAEQEKLIGLLKEKRQAVISHAVTKGLNPTAPMKDSGIEWLGEVPEHWEVKRVKYLVRGSEGIQMGPFGGMLLDLETEDTGFRVYGQQNTISGCFDLVTRWISEERFSELIKYKLDYGDIVLTRKGSLGNARYIGCYIDPGIIDSDTIRIRVDNEIAKPKFISFLLHESAYIEEQISFMKRGAILSGINSETISNIVVILPPINEQNELLNILLSQVSHIENLITEAQQAITLLKERRSALISAAVTGKIDVRGFVNGEDS